MNRTPKIAADAAGNAAKLRNQLRVASDFRLNLLKTYGPDGSQYRAELAKMSKGGSSLSAVYSAPERFNMEAALGLNANTTKTQVEKVMGDLKAKIASYDLMSKMMPKTLTRPKITTEGPPLDMGDFMGDTLGGGGAWPSMAEYTANGKATAKAAKEAASQAKRDAAQAVRELAQQAREADRAYKDFYMAISGRVLDKFELRAFDLKEKEARYLDSIFDPAGVTKKGQEAGRALMQVLQKNHADAVAFYAKERAANLSRIVTGETAHARDDVAGIMGNVKSGALSKRQGVDLLSTLQEQYSGLGLTAALAVVRKGITALMGEASQLKTIKDAIAGAQAKYQELTVTKAMVTAATEAERLSLSLLKTPYISLSSGVRAYVDTLAQATAKTKAFQLEQKQTAAGLRQWGDLLGVGLKAGGAIKPVIFGPPKPTAAQRAAQERTDALADARRARINSQADAIAAPIGQAARASLDDVFNHHSRDWARTFSRSITESMKAGLSDVFGSSVQSLAKAAIRPLFDDLGHQLGRSLSTGLDGVRGNA